MRKRWLVVKLALVIAGAFLFVQAASAQSFTSVTATVVDPKGIPYSGGTMSAVLTPGTPGGWILNGQPYSGRVGPITLDSTGTFTANFGSNAVILPSGTQWFITVNSNQGGIEPPLGTGAQTFSVTIAISGASQNITTTLNAAAPKLTNVNVGGSVPAQLNYFSDYFFRTGANLGANYTNYVNGAIPNSGAAKGTAAGQVNLPAITGVNTTPTQNVTYYNSALNGSTNIAGAAVRINGTAQTTANYYACDEDNTGMFLDKFTGTTNGAVGTRTTLSSSAAVTGNGDYINIQIVGQTITCTLNRTQLVLQSNDSGGYSTGFPGLFLYGGLTATVQALKVASPAAPAGTTINVVCDGDSTVWGSGVWTPWCESLTFPKGSVPYVTNIGVERKGLGTAIPAANSGTIETMIATGTSVVDTLYVPGISNIVVLMQDGNDFAINGTTNAQEITYLTTYIAARHAAGWKVVVVPPLSRTGQDTINQAYGQLLLANAAGADAVVTLPQSLTGPGAYAITQFFIGDGIHPNQFSDTTIIAPAVSAAIGSLL